MAEIGISSSERKNIDSYRQAFAAADADDSNTIGRDELGNALDKVGVQGVSAADLDHLFVSYGHRDGKGLREEEFVDLVTSLKMATKTGLYKALTDKAEYRDAIRVVESNFDNIDQMPTITRKVMRKIEVPYVHEVKVPIKTKKIVPKTVRKQVPVTRLERREGTKMVEEEYIAIEKQARTRMKTIVIEKQVPEEYWEDVEIPKTRMVEVPDVQFVEVDGFDEVEVIENQLVEVDGFRIDQVEDIKIVEIEEEEEIEFVPRETGRTRVLERRDIGKAESREHLTRVMGRIVYDDESLAGIETDDQPDNYQHIRYHTPNPNDRSQTIYKRSDVEGGANRISFVHQSRTDSVRTVNGQEVYGREVNGKWEAGKWINRRWVAGREVNGKWVYDGEGESSSSSSSTTTTTTTTTRTIVQEEEIAGATEEVLGAAGDDEESESL